jgi:hypothetical protein
MLGHKLGVYSFSKIIGSAVARSLALKALQKKKYKKNK